MHFMAPPVLLECCQLNINFMIIIMYLSRRRRFFRLATFPTELNFGAVRVSLDLRGRALARERFGAILEVRRIDPRPSRLESTRARSVWGWGLNE